MQGPMTSYNFHHLNLGSTIYLGYKSIQLDMRPVPQKTKIDIFLDLGLMNLFSLMSKARFWISLNPN